ncbi:MAG: hypothetical protein GXP31_10445 [Kiritimatiellaeota bacterium]|nr:hypothetical protein [Kiritimatiellota bacterium]
MRAVFLRGALRSLVDRRTGEELLAPGKKTFGGARAIPGSGDGRRLDVRAEISGDGRSVTFETGSPDDGVRWTASFADRDAGLVLQAEAVRRKGGVDAVDLVLSGPDWRGLQLALPVGAQGLTLRDPQPGPQRVFRYCGHRQWEAQLAVFEPRPDLPSGARPQSGWTIWAVDRDFAPKSFIVERSSGSNSIRLRTDAQGIPETVRSVRSVRWRIDVFRGDWRGPAARYRAWMRNAFCPNGWRPPEWTARIGAFVKVTGLDSELPAALAARLDPRRTLLVLPNWRKFGYDQNYPDYTAAKGFDQFCREAHRFGFRVMVHFNLFGCAPTNSEFERFRAFILRDRAGKAQGWRLDDPRKSNRHFDIHPGCGAYRRMLVDCIRNVRKKYGVDAFHLDVSLLMTNPRSGPVEGLNVGQAKQELFAELIRAVPGVAFGGEELNESAFSILSFTQRTPFDDDRRRGHPIGFYLFGDRVKYYSHYSQTLSDVASNSATADFLRRAEPAGLYPTLAVRAPGNLNGTGARILYTVAAFFQKYGFVPDVDRPWPADVRFCWREQTPAQRLWWVRGDSEQASLTCGDRTVWLRRSGLDAVGPEWSVPGWPVGDDTGTSGMNPLLPHVLTPGKPFDGTPRFRRFAPELTLDRGELTPEVIRADVVPNRRRTAIVVLTQQQVGMRIGLLGGDSGGQVLPFGRGAVFEARRVLSGVVTLPGFAAHPPWKGGEDKPVAVFAEFKVRLPPEKTGFVLDWFAGMLNPSRGSDGVTYAVEVDGRRVFERHVARKGWRTMLCDLSEFADREIRLRLIVTPGPAGNPTWDLCGWGDPIIRRNGVQGEVRIQSLHPVQAATDDRGRTLPFRRTGRAGVAVPVRAPGKLMLRCIPGRPIPNMPCDLLGQPHRTGQMVPGGLWRDMPPRSDVGKRADRNCGGAVRTSAVDVHPPAYGQTILQWVLKLPARVPAALDLGYGISGRNSRGVSFRVHVDNRCIWRDDMTACGHRTARVSLGDFAGRDVVLDLVTDSMGSNGFDWAIWSRAQLAPQTAAGGE